MWVWYNGCAPAFQAGDMGSIPIIHSIGTVKTGIGYLWLYLRNVVAGSATTAIEVDASWA